MTEGRSASTARALSRRQNVVISLALAVLSVLGVGGWVKTRRFLPSGAVAAIAAAAAAGVLQSLARRVSPTSALSGTAAEISAATSVATPEEEPAGQPEEDEERLDDSRPHVVAKDKDEARGGAKNQAEVAALKAR
jgi:hypothetical protein